MLRLMKELESSRIERTVSTTNKEKFCQAICAFANDMQDSRMPGYLLIGVNDDGSLCGLCANDKILTDLASIRSDGTILPIPSMTVDHVSFEEGDVIVVTVIPSTDPPVRYRGRCYIRVGPRKDIATIEEELILSEKRLSMCKSFDMLPCREASIEDIDIDTFNNYYLPKAVSADILETDNRDIKERMSSLRLFDLKYDCPTNAAIILFGKNPKYYLPGAYIQHVQFDGINNAADISNQNEFAGNLTIMLPKLESFVETSVIKKWPSPVSALKEELLCDYPVWAIRELLMNAVMHRDYSSNTPTKFYQYSDRLEIVNAGGLYGNARPENFPNVNDYRNPVIAEALKTLGFVNKFNRGIARVKEELKNNGNASASFNVRNLTVFSVSVPANVNVSSRASERVHYWKKDGTGYFTFSFLNDLSERREKILRICANECLPQKELLQRVGVTYQTNNVRTHIKPLVEEGLIEKTKNRQKGSKAHIYTITPAGRLYIDFLDRATKKVLPSLFEEVK